ncbi:MAG: SPASM domain-containing protein [Deltaproteobacteria bacterium]|nr:SPASM domain-containing protein [Candidatus Zymogenaceae bacterium]
MTTMIFKPTEACNGNCIYCDVVRKDAAGDNTLSVERLELLFVRINEYLENHPRERFQLIWHGGEPLILGPDYFEQAYRFQQTHCAETKGRLTHEIQSNMTLFSSKFVEIFKKLGITKVSTSYDPIPNIRGLGKTIDSDAYNRSFLKGVRALEEAGLDWAMIYVVTRFSLERPLDLFYFLTNFTPDGSVMFNPVYFFERQPMDLAITPDEFVDFLGKIFTVWWPHRDRYPTIQPFYSLTKTIVDGQPSLICGESGACADSHISLGPSGTLSQCGRSSDWNLIRLGSLDDITLDEAFAAEGKETLRERQAIVRQGDCASCRFWDICHGGCPLDAMVDTGSFMNRSPLCVVKRRFIEEYFEPITGVRYTPEEKREITAAPHPEYRPMRPHMPPPPPGRIRPADRPATGNIWINPIGGLGDALMLSGVLKAAVDRDPTRSFKLIARSPFVPIFSGHPAISEIGHPKPNSPIIATAYWDDPDFREGRMRAYQVLARLFNLPTPIEETLYLADDHGPDPDLLARIPLKETNILVAPSAGTPRKEMPIEMWEELVGRMIDEGFGVIQAGTSTSRQIRGAYSLRGILTIPEAAMLPGYVDAVVTSASFFMHAAHLCDTAAVVLWGPTDHRQYGYSGQAHLQAHCPTDQNVPCIRSGRGPGYGSPCPLGMDHCMHRHDIDDVFRSLIELLEGTKDARRQADPSGSRPAR